MRLGLADELQKLGDAHRHDIHAKCAYYFERDGGGAKVWSWKPCLDRPHEAGELIFLVVSSVAPLDVNLANEFYTRATGRIVENATSSSSGE